MRVHESASSRSFGFVFFVFLDLRFFNYLFEQGSAIEGEQLVHSSSFQCLGEQAAYTLSANPLGNQKCRATTCNLVNGSTRWAAPMRTKVGLEFFLF
jgi:hypothetical protein